MVREDQRRRGSPRPLRHVDRPLPPKPVSLAFCLGVLIFQVQTSQPLAARYAWAEPARTTGPSQPNPNSALADAAYPTVGFSVKNGTTLLEVHGQGGVRFVARVQRDASVSFNARPDKIEVVGQLEGGSTVILADSYPSVSRGLHYCQAGHERFLRVLSQAREVPRETLRVKLESCIDGIELLSPGGLTWEPRTATLHIDWLLGPSVKGRSETLDLRITSGTQDATRN